MSYFGIPVRNGLPIGLGSVAPLASSTSSPFSPASFFANGEQGWWYDPSNFSTLFQDSAGTTPVTAMEQPVGLQLDLSKGLVLGPELVANGDFSSGTTGWVGFGSATLTDTGGKLRATATVTGSMGAAQQVTAAAGKWYKMVFTLVTPVSGVNLFFYLGSSAGSSTYGNLFVGQVANTYTAYFYASGANPFVSVASASTAVAGQYFEVDNISIKELPGNHRFQSTSANRPVVSARVNLFVGTATLATQSVTTRATTHTLTFTGAGSITLTGTALGVYTAGTHSVTTTAGTLTATVLGTVTQADLRETNVGVGLPAYQAVVTSTNYDSTGFPTYIKPNGSNQFMVTNSINFSATDKMTVWQGLRKLSDAGTGVLMELSTTASIGSFGLFGPFGAGLANYSFRSQGTSSSVNTVSGFGAPTTNVLTGIGDISADVNTVRVNAVPTTVTSDQGTGNFGNYPAYFYARSGPVSPFNGHDYGSIARGAASTAAQITAGETYINSKTKAYT